MSHDRSMQYGIGQQLREKKARLESEIEELRALMLQTRDVEPDIADRASTASSLDWNMIRYNRNRSLIKDIGVALKAIENESYGYCELCGEHIAQRRLLAIPGARFCIECQELIDANPDEFARNGLGGDLLTAV